MTRSWCRRMRCNSMASLRTAKGTLVQSREQPLLLLPLRLVFHSAECLPSRNGGVFGHQRNHVRSGRCRASSVLLLLLLWRGDLVLPGELLDLG